MKKFNKIWVVMLALTVVFMAGTKVQALTYNLSTEFSGGTPPVGTAPWLTATFAQNGLNTVRLTMTDTNLTDDEYVSNWLFNLDPNKDATSLTFNYVSGIAATISTGDTIPADGGGYYDILFNFPTENSGRFGVSSTSVYDITFTNLLETDFNFFASSHGGHGVYHTAAHVQGIVGNPTSGWIGDEGGGGGGSQVPEPGTLVLLGAGLFGLAVFGRRKLDK